MRKDVWDLENRVHNDAVQFLLLSIGGSKDVGLIHATMLTLRAPRSYSKKKKKPWRRCGLQEYPVNNII